MARSKSSAAAAAADAEKGDVVHVTMTAGSAALTTSFSLPKARIEERDPDGETQIGAAVARWSTKDESGVIRLEFKPGAADALGGKWDERCTPAIEQYYLSDGTVPEGLTVSNVDVDVMSLVMAFEFMGIEVDAKKIHMPDATAGTKVRSALYVKTLEMLPLAKETVLTTLQIHPKMVSRFIEFQSTDTKSDMEKAEGYTFTYFAGGTASYTVTWPKHSEWVQSALWRAKFIEMFPVGEYGLQLKWDHKYMTVKDVPEFGGGYESVATRALRWQLTVTVEPEWEPRKRHRAAALGEGGEEA